MSFVLDSSVTAAWYLPGEQTPAMLAIRTRLLTEPAVVPALWPFELGSVLLVNERRGRLSSAQGERFLNDVAALPITVASPPAPGALVPLLALARRFGLTAYDAAYLELAQRLGLPLATLDARLAAAAVSYGVSVL